jgi:glucose/arabinose dehydrogenase
MEIRVASAAGCHESFTGPAVLGLPRGARMTSKNGPTLFRQLRGTPQAGAVLLTFLFASCGGGGTSEPTPPASSGGSPGNSSSGGSPGSGGAKGSGGSGGTSSPSGSGGGSTSTGGTSPSGSGGSAGSPGGTGGSAPSDDGGTPGTGGSTSPPDGGPGPSTMGSFAPCTDEPAMEPPALKRTTTIGPFPGAAQTGQVMGFPGETLMYVLGHRSGNVYAVQDGKVVATPVFKVTISTNDPGNEQGLLSMTPHPKFKDNHLFYVYYTLNSRFRVDAYERTEPLKVTMKGNVYDGPGSPQFHNGGTIYFNPKDTEPLLYHSVGNTQNGGAAQMPNGSVGRILRYNVETKAAAPAKTGGVGGFTWGYGLRNPYRMSIDRLTGDLWVGDVNGGKGGNVYMTPWGTEGVNYGNANDALKAGIIGPTDTSGNAIIGGVVYRGNKIKGLCGRYFFGMNNPGTVKSLIQKDGKMIGSVVVHGNLSVPGNLSSFGEDGEGEIWMSSMNNNIYKIEAAE